MAKNCDTISCYSAPNQRPIVLFLFANFFWFCFFPFQTIKYLNSINVDGHFPIQRKSTGEFNYFSFLEFSFVLPSNRHEFNYWSKIFAWNTGYPLQLSIFAFQHEIVSWKQGKKYYFHWKWYFILSAASIKSNKKKSDKKGWQIQRDWPQGKPLVFNILELHLPLTRIVVLLFYQDHPKGWSFFFCINLFTYQRHTKKKMLCKI